MDTPGQGSPEGGAQPSAPPVSPAQGDTTPAPAPTLAVATPPDVVPDAGGPSQSRELAPTAAETHSDDNITLLKKDPEEERRVRQEVLVRVEMLKELTQAEKDHLYSQVERARGFTKLAIVPFPSARVWPQNDQVEHLVSYLRKPNFQKLFEDPTVVLVCVGYADLQGSAAQNLELSRRRAENMVRILQTRTKIRNLMRAVGMGASNLFGKNDAAKNRVVEIWLVQP
jgi:outer membrane protein OmpA-like peptidoglycan-associated protein